MNSKQFNRSRLNFLNPLRLINRFGTGSIAIVLALGVSDVKLAWANPTEPPSTTPPMPREVAWEAILGDSPTYTALPQWSLANSPPLPLASTFFYRDALPSSTSQTGGYPSINPSFTSPASKASPLTPSVRENSSPLTWEQALNSSASSASAFPTATPPPNTSNLTWEQAINTSSPPSFQPQNSGIANPSNLSWEQALNSSASTSSAFPTATPPPNTSNLTWEQALNTSPAPSFQPQNSGTVNRSNPNWQQALSSPVPTIPTSNGSNLTQPSQSSQLPQLPPPTVPTPTFTPPPPTPPPPPTNPPASIPPALVPPIDAQAPPPQVAPRLRNQPVTSPLVQFQGSYRLVGEENAARARLSALYPASRQVQLGATLDLTSEGGAFSDSPQEGLTVNELYVAVAPIESLPNLRVLVGQLDLTSYFDRNSFAKDAVTHFFNPVFQTNPALTAAGILSRTGALVNWTVTDNIEVKAAAFSSSRNLRDFSVDGFAGELGVRYGNFIVRATYASDRDAGNEDGFQEIFSIPRDDDEFGLQSSDREESYGINAELFIPEINMGLFARYGRYRNIELDLEGDTYSFGVNFLDVFFPDDRLGIAYGRQLSNSRLRREQGDEVPDVLELFYDVRIFSNLRFGVTLQQRNEFTETFGGFRFKTDLDVTP